MSPTSRAGMAARVNGLSHLSRRAGSTGIGVSETDPSAVIALQAGTALCVTLYRRPRHESARTARYEHVRIG